MKVACVPCTTLQFDRTISSTFNFKKKKSIMIGRIRMAMKLQNLRGYELANLCGMHQSQFSKILRLEGNPTLETLMKFEEVLGIDILNYQE